MEKKKSKKRDQTINGVLLAIMIIGTVAFALIVLPEKFSEVGIADSNPIEIREEWVKVPSYINSVKTTTWFGIKVSETEIKPENPIEFDAFLKKYENGKIFDVEYVIKFNSIIFYSEDDNGKLWKSISSPIQKFDGYVRFSEPRITEEGIVFTEESRDIFWERLYLSCFTVLLGFCIFMLIRNMIMINRKDYKNNESNKETRS